MTRNRSPITISDLYPDFTEEQREEAEANLRRYLEVLIRMAERLRAEGRSINELADLTCSPGKANVHEKVESPKINQ